MRNGSRENLDLRTASAEEVNRLMSQGAIDAVREHKCAGNSVVVWDWENDRVVIVPPEEIIVPDEAAVEDEPVPTRDDCRS